AGERLGPYEILEPIGAGGMGDVWKARDTRLNRTVAIKVSKEQFSARFEQEARAVAALNHPHICTLHDVGPNYLVMELVEGAPLKGPMPIEKAVEYAGQILELWTPRIARASPIATSSPPISCSQDRESICSISAWPNRLRPLRKQTSRKPSRVRDRSSAPCNTCRAVRLIDRW